MKNYKLCIIEKCIKFLQLQLFISLVSLPLIGAWGLPISSMAIIGNILFTPCVMIFVAFSTLIFFTELVHVPNAFLLKSLEYITDGWYYCLSWGRKEWVIGISDELFIFTCIIAALALVVICHKRWGQLLESTICFAVLYGTFLGAWYYTTPCTKLDSLSKGKATLSLVSFNKEIILYDKELLQRISSAESWVEYTLIPWLIKRTGTIVIHKLYLASFSPKAISAIMYIMDYAQVHRLIIPYFDIKLTSQEWKQFFDMYKKAQKNKVYIERN